VGVGGGYWVKSWDPTKKREKERRRTRRQEKTVARSERTGYGGIESAPWEFNPKDEKRVKEASDLCGKHETMKRQEGGTNSGKN